MGSLEIRFFRNGVLTSLRAFNNLELGVITELLVASGITEYKIIRKKVGE